MLQPLTSSLDSPHQPHQGPHSVNIRSRDSLTLDSSTMEFFRRFTSKKKCAAARPIPRQAAPEPYGEREFRRFMNPSFDANNAEEVRAMTDTIRQESFAAEAVANACRTPVATQPRRYFGLKQQPKPFEVDWAPPPRSPLQVPSGSPREYGRSAAAKVGEPPFVNQLTDAGL